MPVREEAPGTIKAITQGSVSTGHGPEAGEEIITSASIPLCLFLYAKRLK